MLQNEPNFQPLSKYSPEPSAPSNEVAPSLMYKWVCETGSGALSKGFLSLCWTSWLQGCPFSALSSPSFSGPYSFNISLSSLGLSPGQTPSSSFRSAPPAPPPRCLPRPLVQTHVAPGRLWNELCPDPEGPDSVLLQPGSKHRTDAQQTAARS
jgi:hypothetical protein